MLLTPLESVIGIIMNAVSRRFEYQADRFACELHQRLAAKAKANGSTKEGDEEIEEMKSMGERLGKALIGLHVENLSTVWVDWM